MLEGLAFLVLCFAVFLFNLALWNAGVQEAKRKQLQIEADSADKAKRDKLDILHEQSIPLAMNIVVTGGSTAELFHELAQNEALNDSERAS
ncbi:MAG: hypothetical protein NUV56_01930, partial [Candidatus Uhrbacteria bacterium]|nr:hypothetical protein [Candidatus Uhrbacteria bacterium]